MFDIFLTPAERKMSWLKQARAKGLGFLRRLIDMMSGIFFRMAYSLTGSSSMPPISNLLLLEPATSLAAKIRSKKVLSSLQSLHNFTNLRFSACF
jgi:fatty acid amide hydrolase 2